MTNRILLRAKANEHTGERYLCSAKKRGSEKFFIYMDRLIWAVAEQQT